jgi:hypothetical protein
MKTLICLSGQVRSLAPFCESFRRRVVDRLPEKPDLVGHFATPAVAEAECLRGLAAHSEICFEDDPDLGDFERYGEGMKEQRHGIRGNLLQWNNLARCADLKRALEAERGRYDLVIWTRPDLYYLTSIERFRVAPDRIHAPMHDSSQGVMDRMCFGPSREMDIRMRLRDYFVRRFHPERVVGRESAPHWNPESVVAGLIEDELGGRFAKTRLITLRLREVAGGHEVCRPSCYPKKNANDGLDDPAFREVFRRSRKLAWQPNDDLPPERRLPLADVKPLAAVDGRWPAVAAQLKSRLRRARRYAGRAS